MSMVLLKLIFRKHSQDFDDKDKIPKRVYLYSRYPLLVAYAFITADHRPWQENKRLGTKFHLPIWFGWNNFAVKTPLLARSSLEIILLMPSQTSHF